MSVNKKILLVDSRDNFRSSVEMNCIMEDDLSFDLVSTIKSADAIESAANNYKPDIIVIADNVMKDFNMSSYNGAVLYGYETGEDEASYFNKFNISSYGMVNSADQLIALMDKVIPSDNKHNNSTNTQQKEQPVSQPTTDNKTTNQQKETWVDDSSNNDVPVLQEEKNNNYNKQPFGSVSSVEVDKKTNYTSNNNSDNNNSYTGVSVKERLDAQRKQKIEQETDKYIKKQMQTRRDKAKIVTFYAAKGGVGKTTLSTEVAAFLAMTSVGRGKLKVCIVDYNIDFGDVLTTLDFDPEQPVMTEWAAEIRERIENGESPEEIEYSQEEIMERIQCLDKYGLYGLLAPLSHEDSMDITDVELKIILKNLQENGGFDFIVCDTGNNTRDSSVLALEMADYVMLIVTQDVTTASCNSAFLSTMDKVGFDMDKICLIVNNVLPYKYTQVAVSELEEMFPYQCLARIKKSPDVVKANNTSVPVVLQPNHEFTKELGKIVNFLTGEAPTIQKPKRGLFSLFKKF